MQLHGAWRDAMDEARQACELLSGPSAHAAAGMAYYQLAGLHRLRGEFAAAEEAYRQASRWGRAPQPGLALLRLAQGHAGAAAAAIRTALEDAHDGAERAELLSAYADILLAEGDAGAARAAVGELAEAAAHFRAPFLHAVSAQAAGAVLLAEGDARAALTELRHARQTWHELDAPYEAARVRVLTGLACRQLGDSDTAAMELDAARWVFQQLEAAPDLARVNELCGTASKGVSGLTGRELQVLRLIATGKSNRAIAADFPSPKNGCYSPESLGVGLGLGIGDAVDLQAVRVEQRDQPAAIAELHRRRDLDTDAVAWGQQSALERHLSPLFASL
jgi:tetratricopeptide (TPR) repeat protein